MVLSKGLVRHGAVTRVLPCWHNCQYNTCRLIHSIVCKDSEPQKLAFLIKITNKNVLESIINEKRQLLFCNCLFISSESRG
jgi:hypothetical protein